MALKCNLVQVIVLVLFGWLLSLFLLLVPLLQDRSTESTVPANLDLRLNKAVSDLTLLQNQNGQLKKLISQVLGSKKDDGNSQLLFGDKDTNSLLNSHGLSLTSKYEMSKRHVQNDATELWYYIIAQLKNLKKKVEGQKELESFVQDTANNVYTHYKTLLVDIGEINRADGLDLLREEKHVKLSDTVQQRLYNLQNPSDCKTAKKIVCNLNKGCGFGCQVHHAAYCLIMAYATGRTMILKSSGWRYDRKGWEDLFLPVSNTCSDPSGTSNRPWPGKEDTQVIHLPIIDSLNPRPDYLPPAVPSDLADELFQIHGNPIAWWLGQFVRYLMRPQPQTEDMINQAVKDLGFKNPIVGIHIRRTDKVGTEAAFHPLEEYMKYADQWYDTKELEIGEVIKPRRVFIASDDASVIKEAKQKYEKPDYEIIGDPNISKTAGVGTRYTEASLRGIVIDITLLGRADYVVCTFSSQVCRVSYEIMQTIHRDASEWYKSLDDVYYYGGQNGRNFVARLPHKAQRVEEVDVEKGDPMGMMGNHWDGYSKGKNRRTNKVGLFPSFKIVENFRVADFPHWPNNT